MASNRDSEQTSPAVVLLAEDDDEDIYLIKRAFKEARLQPDLHVVRNGEAALRYLRKEGEFGGGGNSPRPDLILLDLKMPKLDGREALRAIKDDPDLKKVPVVVLTTSDSLSDMSYCYEQGAASYITKPPDFDAFVSTLQQLGSYWFNLVAIPR